MTFMPILIPTVMIVIIKMNMFGTVGCRFEQSAVGPKASGGRCGGGGGGGVSRCLGAILMHSSNRPPGERGRHPCGLAHAVLPK